MINWDHVTTGLMLTALGMGVVFLSLAVLQVAIRLIGLAGRVMPPAVAAPAPVPVVESGMPEEEFAAIAAAVSVALWEPHRIHHIRMLQDEDSAAWSRVGRLDIMRSHTPAGQG